MTQPPAYSNVDLLSQVALEASRCTQCDLARLRHKVFFGEGNPNAPLVFVGEGPGQNEDTTGRPFVGRAGALLDECLAECRMNRNHVYICNVIKCRACTMEGGRVKNRVPSSAEIESCSGWLVKQLEMIKPLVIVCLGGPSANSLIHPNFRITIERGKWFTDCRFAPFATAALHPAYILRQEGPAYESSLKTLVDDIEAARRKVIEAKKLPKATLF